MEADADTNGGFDICCSNMLARGRAAPPRLRPKAALRSAPQFGQLSAFLRTVLPQRWQTTENMDAGNVKRVVMLKPSKDMCDNVAAVRPAHAMNAGASGRQQSFVLFPTPAKRRRKTKSEYGVNPRRTSIAFRTYLGPPGGGGCALAPCCVSPRLPMKRRRMALVGCECAIGAAATPFRCARGATLRYSHRDILGAGRRWRDAIL
ncbi:hypothetical protein [Caballeronia sp. BCC1704]|uniref:hypothetical protein n=1 Tax=Caballeronia sp. BCC1704 TaxID=2676300 RepID=UPI001FC8A264|nr:hypothetical protein [Caballeronia sp. BCC1704]